MCHWGSIKPEGEEDTVKAELGAIITMSEK